MVTEGTLHAASLLGLVQEISYPLRWVIVAHRVLQALAVPLCADKTQGRGLWAGGSHESGGDKACKAAVTVLVASLIRCLSLFLLRLVWCWYFLVFPQEHKETKLQGCQQQDVPMSFHSWSLPV